VERKTEAFPAFLDYVYSEHGELNITIEKSLAMFRLFDFLQVESLKEKVVALWNEMKVDECGKYLRLLSGQFPNEILRSIVVKICVENVPDIPLDSDLLQVYDVKFWVSVMDEHSNRLHCRLGLLVAKFCTLHKSELDNDTFKGLCWTLCDWTEEKVEACLQMLQVEKHITPDAFTVGSQPTNFQEKCAHIMSLEWKQIWNSPTIQPTLQSLNLPGFQALLYKKCLGRSICENEALLDLHANGEYAPTTITVSGAKTSCVNGEYTRAAYFESDNPKYSMDGTYDDKSVTFSLYQVKIIRMWRISAPQDGADKVYFYNNPAFTTESISNFPPKTGWQGGAMYYAGEGDGPTLTFNFGNDN